MLRRIASRKFCFFVAAICAGGNSQAAEQLSMPPQVQAILNRNCVKCHGPLEQNAGLRLDSAAGALRGSEDGPVVKIGDAEGSKLLAVLAADAEPHMPPKKQLTDGESAVLRGWIAADKLPSSSPAAAAENVPAEPSAAIDHFLAAAWQARGITPARLRRGARVEVLSTGSFWRGGDKRQPAPGAGLRKYDVGAAVGTGNCRSAGRDELAACGEPSRVARLVGQPHRNKEGAWPDYGRIHVINVGD
jgi:cytochrome c551/c552